jgi:DNA-binding Xre family transcriptional regulator
MTTRFRLAELLTRLGVSQAELSRRSGLSLRTVNRIYLNQTGQVSLATLDAIAAALDVEPGDLIGR